jgi:tetratricopeptide (TPR) repeat protein
MKRIRIFLASSITDLKFDRIEIGNFFRQLNDIYIENGIYFDLVMCEDYDNGIALEGKQSEFDRLLCDSELVFFVFFNKVGEYTRHEFEIALDSYKVSKKPKIVTYFKYVTTVEEATEDVRCFMNMLDTELRHYYNVYREIDTLKLGMFMQIKFMRLDNSELTIESGKVMYGKTQIAETKNIPMFECNEKLKNLKDKLIDAESKFRSAKVAFLKSGNDDDYLAFSDAASEKEKIEKELRQLENAVLLAAEKMYETTTDGRVLSEKQKQAYRYMEKGEWELALAILDKNEIISELSHNQSLGDGIIERIAVNVGELLQRIEVLRAAGLDRKVIDEILSLYDTVYDVTVKYGLDLKPIAQYVAFLHDDISQTDKAEQIAKKLAYFYEDPDKNVSLEDRVELVFLRGKICIGLKKYDDAIEMLEGGIKISDELYVKEGARVAALCGGVRNIMANALFFSKKKSESYVYYEDAKYYYQIAYDYDPQENKTWLAMIYDNYGNIIEQVEEDFDMALEYHIKALRLYYEAMEENEKHKKSLSRVYHNTALCYKKLGVFDKSEQYLLEAIRLREEIRQKNDIIEVISEYVELRKQGERYIGLCPFHEDKTKIFSVNQSTQMYYCLGCGAGGNVITFIMEYKNCTLAEAVKFLAERGKSTSSNDVNEIAK